MKKKLEAELISIAHRILQMKNKSDIDQLYVETRRLYEKLSVMRFVEDHFNGAQPTIGRQDVEAILDDAWETEEVDAAAVETTPPAEAKPETPAAEATSEEEVAPAEVTPEEETTTEEEATENAEPETEEEAESESVVAEPEAAPEEPEAKEPEAEEPAVEPEPEPSPKPVQASFEDLLMHHYDEPVFVKAGGDEDKREEVAIEVPETPLQPESVEEVTFALSGTPEPEERQTPDPDKFEAPQPSPLADSGKAISIGLNDRIGFEKNLFGGSSEDLNRVLSQLNTLATFDEARDFIEQMVKPDYNNWTGKEDYEQRFLEVIERKFT